MQVATFEHGESMLLNPAEYAIGDNFPWYVENGKMIREATKIIDMRDLTNQEKADTLNAVTGNGKYGCE